MEQRCQYATWCKLGCIIIAGVAGACVHAGMELSVIRDTGDIVRLFKLSPEDIAQYAKQYADDVKKALDVLVAIPRAERTFSNTVEAFDALTGRSKLAVFSDVVSTVGMVDPRADMREAARVAELMIRIFHIDHIGANKDVYNALKGYAQGNALQENLSAEQWYYLNELIDGYRKSGMELPSEQHERTIQLRKEISALTVACEKNLASDNRTITTSREELAGTPHEFIASLQVDGDLYVLGIDYPTYMTVMENCMVEETRKRLYRAFTNRGYPANDIVLHDILNKRHELASLLGFPTFAHLNIDGCMAKKPEVVEKFLYDLLQKASAKEAHEFELLTKTVPPSVELTPEGALKPWDVAYLHSWYKKQYFSLNEQQIAEYFPQEYVTRGLFSIYETFLSLKFEIIPLKGLWHEEVQCVAIYTSDTSRLLGYVLLDLYPRPDKFGHACQQTIVPSLTLPDGTQPPALGLVIANFTRGIEGKPALWPRNQVQTLFHEFGHALHSILGRTSLVATSGTNVKMDFVELPSQMLEYWLSEGAILKKISKHYQTGEQLPDAIIETITKIRRFNSGYFVQRQIGLALLSLMCHQKGDKSLYELSKEVHTLTASHVAYDPENHFYTGFGHLTGYAARYYSYLWAEVFACDVFAEIKKQGLLNPEIGARYVEHILGKGGSKDPYELLCSFLGRPPTHDAFLERL
jgi:thimet oligopeptidase